ncbi:DUF502 domain-containing protein [Bdellovibrio sp. HCB290]|uniref:DUF502 domain-containing protein n=1 Tax=Bdellovibrio sp. HCB290 TaxID=3394356 RepID=UPI0039B54943
MRGLKSFVKSSLLAAAGVILPVILLLMLVGKIIAVVGKVTSPIAQSLSPRFFNEYQYASETVAFGVLLLLSLALGAFAQTRMGRSIGGWIEDVFLMRLRVYRSFKEFSQRLIPSQNNFLFQPALLVREDEMNALVFIVEEIEGEQCVIFTPSAPSTLSGSLFIVPSKDVKKLNVPVGAVAKTFSRWGVGTLEVVRKGSAEPYLQAEERPAVQTPPIH